MAFADFPLPNAYTTTQTLFGGAYQWMKLPQAFPPIQYISTSSIAFPATGDFEGVLFCADTTSAGVTVAQVGGYIKGDKWFYLSGAGHLPIPLAGIHASRVRLYYRAVGEGVEI